ncbi:sensor histidine kinase [Actinomadura sp. 3N407]|uniref:sensor histidine kinase n=1 Tax=Actinomadura sp. 3N407 TaxID=3457423 RepID=UPI003FCEAB56
MESSAAERGAFPERVGSAFRMLMEIRMLITALSMLLLPREQLTVGVFVLMFSMVLLSWGTARQWRFVAPRVAAHPSLYTLDMFLSFAVLGVGGIAGPYFLSTVATATVAGLLYRWQGMLFVASLQILVYYLTYALTASRAGDLTFQALLGQPLYYPLAGFVGVALRRLLDDYAAKETALRQAQVLAAASQERARLAREMHDSLAKTLRGIALAASALPLWASRDQTRAALEAEQIATAAAVASREARDLLTELRDDAITRSLHEALRDVADRWAEQTGIAVTCDLDARIEPELRMRHEAVAILREVLTNVERHAKADSVKVRLVKEQDDLVLTIADDGAGFQLRQLPDLAREGHYGLIGLHERAQRVGGTVTISSEPGDGTTVSVRLPADVSEDVPSVEVS